METLDQLIKQRLTKLAKARKAGPDPYQSGFKRDGPIASFLASFEEGRQVKAAGRLTAIRSHGKTTFADLKDASGRVQLLFSEEELKERYARIEELDLGDIVGVEGAALKTKTGEPTLRVSGWQILSKALRPPPEKWHGLKDVELRYRKRYLDLLANPETRETFLIRSRLITGIRRFLDSRGFLEVETPMMQPIPGGAAGKPFKTRHNALGMDLYLRIAPELYLKRLLVGGLEKVYEVNRSFRNEGLSTRHNPEFTMLEVYEAYGDCQSMMALTEELVSTLAAELRGTSPLTFAGKTLDLARPWKRVSLARLLEDKFKIKPTDSMEALAKAMKLDLGAVPKNQLAKVVLSGLDELFQHQTSAPVFVTDFLKVFSPLAKSVPGSPLVADRFELFIGGLEVANAYTEQNDPAEQRRSFQGTQALGGDEAQAVDEDFLEALEYGMPPAGGLGVGIDRLAMLLAGCDSIRDVILFPTLRPEG
ncbi:MAG: lysine--tRNA ligase [Candidatus Omnitrophica bacterium]|nr:lysine--tRNA ligase [Candidatus Omnitrophota bacterium]